MNKKMHLKKENFRYIKSVVFLLLLIAFSNTSWAQIDMSKTTMSEIGHHDDEETVLISNSKSYAIGDSLTAEVNLLMPHSEQLSWSLLDQNGSVLISGNKPQIEGFIFDKPGNYKLVANVKGHFVENAFVVSEQKIIFHTDQIQFSKPVQVGMPADGISVTIPISVNTFNKKSFLYNKPLYVAGVNVTLSGNLSNPVELKDGNYTLTYNLTGNIPNWAYVMFDFQEPSGNVQSYTTLIK